MFTTDLPPPFDKIKKTDLKEHDLQANQTLFRQNEKCQGLFYLVSGAIDLQRTTTTGHQIVIHRARPGDTFAEASLYADQYHCTAIAQSRSLIVECKLAVVMRLLEGDTDFIKALAARFAKQIQQGRRRVEILSIRAADERILAALADGLLIEDISDFADYIGLAPETVYRALSRMSRNGTVQKTARGQYQMV